MFAEPISEQWQHFAQIREDICIDYSYNTARAYWGDLDDIFRWAIERGKDVLALTDGDLAQYLALLRRRKYSENTIRRKRVVWTKLRTSVSANARTDAAITSANHRHFKCRPGVGSAQRIKVDVFQCNLKRPVVGQVGREDYLIGRC